ncbi:MAG: YicC family protein [Bacteroidales bacterium]|nr:YicC family protein [Bacteroidales bacterium]
MLYSMTGFGRAVVETPDKKITVEVKSLNSKQMDLTVRLPQQLRDAESEIRNLASRLLQRGKVDVVAISESTVAEATACLNLPALKAYKAQIVEMASELQIPLPADWYSVLFRFPDSMHSDIAPDAPDEDLKAVVEASSQAINALIAHRRSEGLRLEEFFTKRIHNIQDLLAKIPAFEEERITRIRSRIEENLAQLNKAEYDHGRFEQEMIFYIEKLDISEEKQRLAQHLSYFLETMAEADGGQGKKLGFISQEMGREINTLGSKSNQADMQRLVVMMKDELEQIKEQVLNVM